MTSRFDEADIHELNYINDSCEQYGYDDVDEDDLEHVRLAFKEMNVEYHQALYMRTKQNFPLEYDEARKELL